MFILIGIVYLFSDCGNYAASTTPPTVSIDDSLGDNTYEKYEGLYLLSDQFDEEYVLSLVGNTFQPDKYYPVPSFAPGEMLVQYQKRFNRYKADGNFEGFNKTVRFNFYWISYKFDLNWCRDVDCSIPYEDDLQAFNDSRKYWIYYNIHAELNDVDRSDTTMCSDTTDNGEDKENESEEKYWEKELREQQERAKVDAGIVDFSVFY